MNFEKPLPHHARGKSRLPARRLDVFLQEAVGFLAGVAGPRVGPGAALVVGGAGGLAGIVAIAGLDVEVLVIAAEAVDRGLHRAIARLDDAGAADTRNAAAVRHPRRHAVLEPADRAGGHVGRIVEAPRPAAPVTLADQRAIRRIAGDHGHALIVPAGTVETGLRQRRARRYGRRQKGKRHHTRPEQATSLHLQLLSNAVAADGHLIDINLYGG